MIKAVHTLIYSDDPEATRAFLRDVLNWPYVNDPASEPGWLIFKTGPSEMGIHPTSDTYEGKVNPSERTLCGHVDQSPRGMGTWQAPHAPAGALQNKITDSAGAAQMTLSAALGHACGASFKASEHLAKYPEVGWMREIRLGMPNESSMPSLASSSILFH